MKACGRRFLKVVLLLLNLLFMVVGLVLTGAGAWAVADQSSFSQLAVQLSSGRVMLGDELLVGTNYLLHVSIAILVIGLVVFFLAFLGCWGIVIESANVLILYTSLLSALLVAQIVCVILLVALQAKVRASMETTVTETFSQRYRGTLGAFAPQEFDQYSTSLDNLMIRFDCCGIHGPEDFSSTDGIAHLWLRDGRRYNYTDPVTKKTIEHSGDNVFIPPACCTFKNTLFYQMSAFDQFASYMTDVDCPIQHTNVRKTGCLSKFATQVTSSKTALVVVVIVTVILQLCTIAFASILARNLRMSIY